MSEVTPALRSHLDALAAKASLKGGNLWNVLNAAGLLYTEDRRRYERTHALRSAREELEKRSVPQLVGSAYAEGRTTAKDMRRGITEFLAEREDLARKGQA